VIFRELTLTGAFLVEIERLSDERGFFARTFCRRDFERRGLDPNVVQCNVSYNERRGTLRGMHLQVPPDEEAKLISCTAGAIFDVIIDLRPASATFRRWHPVELRGGDGRALYVPRGFAHGFQTLEPCTAVTYQMSTSFAPGSARGYRWDDPAFAIAWPLPDPILSAKDRSYPLLDPGDAP
jgi:dTDP-4-dehydrorhamnose 3,5-epimerase